MVSQETWRIAGYISLSMIVMIGLIVTLASSYTYAFKNPDPAFCYYILGLDTVSKSIETVQRIAKENNIEEK